MNIVHRSLTLAGLLTSPLTSSGAQTVIVPETQPAGLAISDSARKAIAAALSELIQHAPSDPSHEIMPLAFFRQLTPSPIWRQEGVSMAGLNPGEQVTQRILNRFRLILPPAFRHGDIDAYFYLHQSAGQIHLLLRDRDGAEKRFVAEKPTNLHEAGSLRLEDFRTA